MISKTKKLIAVFLSVLMIGTSVPFAAYAGTDADLESLKNEIAAFESKMDGSMYTNIKPAYTAYVKAYEAGYAYEVGNKKDIDLQAAANNLAAQSALMTKWNGLEVESPGFSYGSVVPDDYSKGIMYTSIPVVAGGYKKEDAIFKFILPQYAVIAYTGDEVRIPIMCAFHNNSGLFYRAKGALSLFLNPDIQDTTNDNKYFQLGQTWRGFYEMTKEGGPSAASDFDWNSTWNRVSVSSSDGYWADFPGYNKDTDAATGKDNKGGYQPTNNGNKWWQYANYITYVGKNEAWQNGYQEAPFSFTGHSYRGKDFNENDYHYYFSYSESTTGGRWGGKYYAIDYSNVKSTVNNAANQYLKTARISNLLRYELNDVLTVMDALIQNPSSETITGTNLKSEVETIAGRLISNINSLNNANVPVGDLSDYDALADAIATTKAIYDANNAGDIYTADSFAAFKTAYQNSVAEAAKVYTDGFTTATTATALTNAYKALNAVVKPTGSSGDTTYTYDSTTGTVTITGPGAMADYDSAEQSPFGNNDEITTVIIGDGVTNVGENTFKNCRNLKVITVPSSLIYGKGAFDDCPELETVYITGGEVKNVSRANAPWNLSSVVDVHLGTDENDLSVSAIGNSVFRDCSKKAFYIYNTNCVIPTATVYTFGTEPTIHGFVPSTAYSYHKDNNTAFVSLGHKHSWVVVNVVPETCVSSGYTEYKCEYEDVCSAKKIDDYKSALGHNFEYSSSVLPTCTQNGYDVYKCTRCEYEKKQNYLKAIGHNFDTAPERDYQDNIVVNPLSIPEHKHKIGCSNGCGQYKEEHCSFVIDGVDPEDSTLIIFRCVDCNGRYRMKSDAQADEYTVFFFGSDSQLKKSINVKKGQYVNAEDVPALKTGDDAHSYAWDVEPTSVVINDVTVFREIETVNKYTVRYHDDVEDIDVGFEEVAYGSKPADVPLLPSNVENMNVDGHNVYAWVGDVNPETVTITEETVFHYGKKLVAHNFEDTVIEAPSCTAVGYISRYCNDCEYRINEVEVPKVAHTPEAVAAVDATCTKGGKTAGSKCSVCGTVLEEQKPVDALGHSWDKGKKSADGKKITYTCTRKGCGATKTEDVKDSGNTPSPKPTPAKPSDPLAAITPSDAVADKAPVNKSIKRPGKVRTTSLSKKKQMRVRFSAISGAANYRVMYRKAGEKAWHYAWTEGKTEYYLKNLAKGGLYEFCFAAYKKNAKGQWERGNYSKVTRRYYYKHALKKYKGKNGTITLKWKKKKGATAYQVQYSTKKSMAGAKTITISNPKQTSYKITGLKKGKKYYVRVRANKKYNKKNFTGEYSKRRKVVA